VSGKQTRKNMKQPGIPEKLREERPDGLSSFIMNRGDCGMIRTALVVLFFSLLYLPVVEAQRKGSEPVDTSWYTPGDLNYNLLVAAYLGREGDLERFLRQGAYVNTSTMNGNTPLHLAAQEGHLPVVCKLLLHGADIDETDKEGMTPLMKAVVAGHAGVVTCLLDHGASPEARDRYGRTPLILAAAYGSPSLVRLLLDRGASPVQHDKQGNTPLMVAVYAGNRETAVYLLRRGAPVEERDKRGFTPLLTAVQRGDTALARLLLRHGASLGAATSSGYTPLLLAVQEHDTAMARLLLEADTAGIYRSGTRHNAVSLASDLDDAAMKELLIEHDIPYRRTLYLDHMALGGELWLNGRDFMPGLFFSATEGVTLLSLDAGFLYRAFPARILVPDGEHRFYQFREYRGVLYGGAGKAFLLNKQKAGAVKYGPEVHLHAVWSFGPRYAGSSRKPPSLFTVSPTAGIYVRWSRFMVSASYTWLDLDTYDLSPHHFSLRLAWVLDRRQLTGTRKVIPWLQKNGTP